jgi:hypothetical protein
MGSSPTLPQVRQARRADLGERPNNPMNLSVPARHSSGPASRSVLINACPAGHRQRCADPTPVPRNGVMVWLSAALLLAASARPAEPKRQLHVAVLALEPDLTVGHPSGRLAKEFARRLEAGGFRVTQLGVAQPLPAEEAIAQATVSRAAFVVAVEATGACSALLVPPKVSEPSQHPTSSDQSDLAALIKKTQEASRYKHSAAVAASLRGSTSWCERSPGEIETFVLRDAAAPVVVLRVTPASLDSVARALPRALRSAFRDERP